MSRDFVGALLQLNAEKQVPQEALIRAVEEGIQAAYRRVAGEEDIFVSVEPATGEIRVFRGRYVVNEVEDPMVEVTVDEARATHPDAKPGDVIELEQLDGEHFGRIGAQTAKQIILQRMREVERDQVFDQFANREGDLLTGSVSRVEPRAIILDVGKGVEAVLADQRAEPARALPDRPAGQGLRARGPTLRPRTPDHGRRAPTRGSCAACSSSRSPRSTPARSRSRRSRARRAAAPRWRSPRGRRASTRSARRSASAAPACRPWSPSWRGEKIDVIPWNEDPSVFVANALSPAQVLGVRIDEEHRIANVTVPERMLSLAIGREGQNARLAARLTGWRIDIRSDVAGGRCRRPEPRDRARGAACVPEAAPARVAVPRPELAAAAPAPGGDGARARCDGPEPLAQGTAQGAATQGGGQGQQLRRATAHRAERRPRRPAEVASARHKRRTRAKASEEVSS